jgi:hypothetical protein
MDSLETPLPAASTGVVVSILDGLRSNDSSKNKGWRRINVMSSTGVIDVAKIREAVVDRAGKGYPTIAIAPSITYKDKNTGADATSAAHIAIVRPLDDGETVSSTAITALKNIRMASSGNAKYKNKTMNYIWRSVEILEDATKRSQIEFYTHD